MNKARAYALGELAKPVKFTWVVYIIGLEKPKNGSSQLSRH